MLCNDLAQLESVQAVLEYMVGAAGSLRREVGEAHQGHVELPSAHQAVCNSAILRSQKRREAIHAWRRAQQLKAAKGHVCVRYEGSHVALNEAFDVVDRHDDDGYTLDFPSVDDVFQISPAYEGAYTYMLVQEDVGNSFDVRAWMARPRVVGRDGAPKRPNDRGIFSHMKPNCQYRLEVMSGTRRDEALATVHTALGREGLLKGVTVLHDDAALMEDASSCSCLWGNPCVSQYNCKDWANRAEVAKRNGWKG